MSKTATVIAAVKEHGPISSHELSQMLGMPLNAVSGCITRRRDLHQIRIAGWSRDEGSSCTRLQALYGPGTEPDEKKPKPMSRTQINKRYRERQRKASINSVFALGIPVNARRVINRLGTRKESHAQIQ